MSFPTLNLAFLIHSSEHKRNLFESNLEVVVGQRLFCKVKLSAYKDMITIKHVRGKEHYFYKPVMRLEF